MAAAWFKVVRRRICLDYNDTDNKLFHKCFTNSASIVHRSHLSHVTVVVPVDNAHAPEPIAAELNKPMTYPKKQTDLYLQRCELDRDFASGSVPFRSVHLN